MLVLVCLPYVLMQEALRAAQLAHLLKLRRAAAVDAAAQDVTRREAAAWVRGGPGRQQNMSGYSVSGYSGSHACPESLRADAVLALLRCCCLWYVAGGHLCVQLTIHPIRSMRSFRVFVADASLCGTCALHTATRPSHAACHTTLVLH